LVARNRATGYNEGILHHEEAITMNEPKTTGQIIRERREALKLTQEDLAERLGVSRQAVSKWESDLSAPTSANLQELCRILDVSFEGIGEPEPEPVPKKRNPVGSWLGWGVAVVLAVLLLVQAICGGTEQENAQPEQIEPEIIGVDFYDEQGKLIPELTNWYELAESTTIIVTFQGDSPTTVTVYLTPTGTETADLREQLAVVMVPDGQNYALLHLNPEDGAMGHLEVALDYGETSIHSGIYNVIYDEAD
jgi:transcriptional regulator with XRE-family HTH domain